jgi:putative phage-type endonuclease
MTTLLTPADAAEKALKRRETLGASDSPAALGLSPWTSPRALYLSKIGMVEDSAPNLPMRVGLALENLIASLYQEETGKAVMKQQVAIRSRGDHPFLSATLDGITNDNNIVEFKTIGERKGAQIGDEGSDQLPDHWLIQAHQQMYLHGTDKVDFAVLIGNTAFKVLTVQRHEALLQTMLPRLAEFWACVQRRELPLDSYPSDERLMHLLYPDSGPGIDLEIADQVDVGIWESCRFQERSGKKSADELKFKLLERLGNASYGRLPDGRLLTRKIVSVKERTQVVKSYSYTDLRIKTPKAE